MCSRAGDRYVSLLSRVVMMRVGCRSKRVASDDSKPPTPFPNSLFMTVISHSAREWMVRRDAEQSSRFHGLAPAEARRHVSGEWRRRETSHLIRVRRRSSRKNRSNHVAEQVAASCRPSQAQIHISYGYNQLLRTNHADTLFFDKIVP